MEPVISTPDRKVGAFRVCLELEGGLRNMYMHVRMYVYTYIYICMFMSTFLCTYICIYNMCIHISVYLFMYLCACPYIYTNAHAQGYICVSVYM